MTNNLTEFEAAFSQGMAAQLTTTSVNGIDHAIIPENAKLQSFERLMPAPQRIRARHTFHDVDSFARYFNEFADESTRIFVDETRGNFTAVFDCDHKDKPAWGEHMANLEFCISPEWRRFCNLNNERMRQKEFAEFIEDSIEYITGPGEYTGAKMLEVAQNVAIDIKGTFQCNDTTAQGLKILNIKDESTAAAQIGDKKIAIPTTLDFSLRVYRGSASYKFSALLRHRANKDGIVFWYTIPDLPRVQELAFNNVIEQVDRACNRVCFRGEYGHA